jgi:hypothetical protein
MKSWPRSSALLCTCLALLSFAPASADLPQEPFPAGRGSGASRETPEDIRLPNGKMQRDEILKAEHEQNIKDAAQLVDLAEDLKADLEKNDRFVLPLGTLKKTDEIEKLVKKIRSRLRH